jgi:aspartate/methionine/tyrosine aminotransferase
MVPIEIGCGAAERFQLTADAVDGHRFMRFSFAVSTDRIETACERLAAWFARASTAA